MSCQISVFTVVSARMSWWNKRSSMAIELAGASRFSSPYPHCWSDFVWLVSFVLSSWYLESWYGQVYSGWQPWRPLCIIVIGVRQGKIFLLLLLLLPVFVRFFLLWNSLNHSFDTWKISRYAFFSFVCLASFCWYWFPDFIFPALSYFNFPCWINPKSPTVNQIFGMNSGMGLLPITFDCKVLWSSPFIDLLANQIHRGPSLIRWISLAGTFVGCHQYSRISCILDLDCRRCLLLHQCVDDRLFPIPEFQWYVFLLLNWKIRSANIRP